jgi:glycosyltransferase involved in cell wall biosynthesis
MRPVTYIVTDMSGRAKPPRRGFRTNRFGYIAAVRRHKTLSRTHARNLTSIHPTAATSNESVCKSVEKPGRVLHAVLIAHAFPPFPASGALRPYKVALALSGRGHRVQVLTARLPGERPGQRVSEPGLTVTPIRYIPNPRHWYVALKNLTNRIGKRRSGPADAGGPVDVPPESLPTWKRWILSVLHLPDDEQGFAAATFARGVAAVYSGANLVYTTSPGISAHVAGLALKRLTGVRWAAEFRDIWTHDASRRGLWYRQSRFSVAIEQWLELTFLRRADLVIANAAGLNRHLMELADHDRPHRFLLVRNGIADLQSARTVSTPDSPLRIAYLGTLGMARDPRPLLTAIAAVIKDTDGPGFIVDLVGDCDWYKDTNLRTWVDEAGLGAIVHFHGWLPHGEAQALMHAADLLVVLAQEQPDAVPNKLYEYLGTRKPIIAFADDAGETASMLREVGGHQIMTEHDGPESVRAAITHVLRERSEGVAAYGDEAILRDWTTERQMETLAAALEA